ncbi:hypothetical protein WJX74_006021 [Apatococcus lobatus]|uniref:Uncharacterized protein n=1 Tax=Apatococcus lobatus TaxID=904363 RepID=A0AAW1S5W7_9CHLO
MTLPSYVFRAAIVFYLFSRFCGFASGATRSPVVVVPGLAGSVLEERIIHANSHPWWWFCQGVHDWQVLWFSLQAASRPNCLLDEMQIHFDPNTGRYHNQTGVEIRPYDWGGLTGVAALDPDAPSYSGTYSELIKGLQDKGYTAKKDLFGAPFDFRLNAEALQQVGFFTNLTLLVEAAVEGNEGSKATIVAHSMGALATTFWLSRKGDAWVDQHIAAFISVSAPWQGSPTALKGSISGDNFDISVIPHDLLRPLQSTAPSGPWLFPASDVWGDKILVETAGGDKYKASDALQMLHDLNLTQQAELYGRSHGATYPLPKLNVPMYCLHGSHVSTDYTFQYDVQHFSAAPPPAPASRTSGDGDGTVDIRSLTACKEFGPQVKIYNFPNASHLGILQQKDAVAGIIDLIHTGSTRQHIYSSWRHRLQQFKQSLLRPWQQSTDSRRAGPHSS